MCFCCAYKISLTCEVQSIYVWVEHAFCECMNHGCEQAFIHCSLLCGTHPSKWACGKALLQTTRFPKNKMLWVHNNPSTNLALPWKRALELRAFWTFIHYAKNKWSITYFYHGHARRAPSHKPSIKVLNKTLILLEEMPPLKLNKTCNLERNANKLVPPPLPSQQCRIWTIALPPK